MPNKLTELISSIMSELKQIAATETIIGEPVKLGDKMVVPVTKLLIGFGVGGGEGQADDKGTGFGGGGGGGARIEPVGFIVIEEDKVSFLPTKPGKYEGIIDAIPGVIDQVRKISKSMGKGKGENKDEGKPEAEEK